MFFNIIGFIALIFILGNVSLVYGMFMLNGIGRYNIGGVPNTTKKKITLYIGLGIVIFLWYLLFKHSPISFSLKS